MNYFFFLFGILIQLKKSFKTLENHGQSRCYSNLETLECSFWTCCQKQKSVLKSGLLVRDWLPQNHMLHSTCISADNLRFLPPFSPGKVERCIAQMQVPFTCSQFQPGISISGLCKEQSGFESQSECDKTLWGKVTASDPETWPSPNLCQVKSKQQNPA